jgi:hypothetical protein
MNNGKASLTLFININDSLHSSYRLGLVTESSLPKIEDTEMIQEEEAEHLTKLQQHRKGIQTGYLFEASDKDSAGNYTVSAEDRKSIHGAIQNLQIEFGMLGFLTWGPEDTLDFCLQMNTKLPQYLEGRNIEISYVAHTKRSQKSKNGYKTLLTTIEGVSSTKADAIKSVYPTFKALWKAWETAPDPTRLLANIDVSFFNFIHWNLHSIYCRRFRIRKPKWAKPYLREYVNATSFE